MNMKLVVTSLVTVSCGLAVALVSCNGDDINAPDQPSRGVKMPHALNDNCNGTQAVDRCPVGTAAFDYDEDDGQLTVTNLNDATSGISSTFGATRNWLQIVDADIPEQDGKKISAVAYNGAQKESQLDVVRDQDNLSQVNLTPTFLAGDGEYNVEIYDDGDLIATQENVPPDGGPVQAARVGFWRWIKFHVRIGFASGQRDKAKGAQLARVNVETGACEWVLSDDRGDNTSFTLPDGSVVSGDEIRFIEVVDGSGRYPYHSADRVDILTNVGSYTILAEYAGS